MHDGMDDTFPPAMRPGDKTHPRLKVDTGVGEVGKALAQSLRSSKIHAHQCDPPRVDVEQAPESDRCVKQQPAQVSHAGRAQHALERRSPGDHSHLVVANAGGAIPVVHTTYGSVGPHVGPSKFGRALARQLRPDACVVKQPRKAKRAGKDAFVMHTVKIGPKHSMSDLGQRPGHSTRAVGNLGLHTPLGVNGSAEILVYGASNDGALVATGILEWNATTHVNKQLTAGIPSVLPGKGTKGLRLPGSKVELHSIPFGNGTGDGDGGGDGLGKLGSRRHNEEGNIVHKRN
eukprot:14484169-Alexandrium_andersonii.AAC.1